MIRHRIVTTRLAIVRTLANAVAWLNSNRWELAILAAIAALCFAAAGYDADLCRGYRAAALTGGVLTFLMYGLQFFLPRK